MSSPPLLYLAEAVRILRDHMPAATSESVFLHAACGRVLAHDLASALALPQFDHAAMDGYALRADPPLAAGAEYVVIGSRAAGDAIDAAGVRDASHACEIMTGAPLPAGLDAVVALEQTERLQVAEDGSPRRIRLLEPLASGRNVRRAGSDVAAGAVVLRAGTWLSAKHAMLLAALGINQIEVLRRPRVAVICTGKELQGDPTQMLGSGQIHNSNGPFLCAALAAAGAQVLSCDTVDDSAATYHDALRRAVAAGAELVLSTGAVSMGRYDFVPDVLARAGAQLLFHKLAIRPGRPVLAARLQDGPLVIALPGTPMAVAAGLRFLVVPALRGMLGQDDEPPLHAILDTPQQPRAGIRHLLRARLYQDPRGRIHASVQDAQQPFRIQPFAQADAWLVLPEDSGDCALGSVVEIVGLLPGSSPDFSGVPS